MTPDFEEASLNLYTKVAFPNTQGGKSGWVIYAGFVATNGLPPSSEREAEGGAIVPNNKASYTTTQTTSKQTLALIIYHYNK
jgi:hypothetical protein